MKLFVNKKVKQLFCAALVFTIFSTELVAQEELTIAVDSYKILGDSPLSKQVMQELLADYTGEHRTVDQIQQAADALLKKIRDEGYGFYQVELAPQTLDTKQVKLLVKGLKIDQIYVHNDKKENSSFSDNNVRQSIPSLEKGFSPNLNKISRQLELANLNPSKKANIQFSASDKADKINADIVVNEINPSKIFAWINNTGGDDTGDYRIGLGYKNNNLFDKDHDLSISYTTSPDHLKEVQQYGINYRIPFYQYQGIWQLYAYYSDVDSGTVAGGFDVSGKGTFLGTKYEWYLPKMEKVKNYGHHLVFGLDDKLFDNNVFFASQPLGVDVRATPLSLAYFGKLENLSNSLDFYVKYEHNLEVGSHNDNLAYALSRHNASPDWDVFKMGLTYHWLKNGYHLLGKFDAQYADQELISGEMFGMGGLTGNIRGFKEREIIGDKGIKGSIELWSPSLFKSQINALAFTDVGYSQRINPLPNEEASDTIMSVGLGITWKWKNSIDLSAYVAHVTNGSDSTITDNPTQKGDNKIHFNLFMSY